jgi:membrane protease YdiL (CAAX protease family)
MSDSSPIAGAPEPHPRYPFWGYQDMVLFVGLALPSLLIAALLLRVVRTMFPEAPRNHAFDAVVVQFLGYLLLFLCLYGLLRLRYGRPFWSSLAWEGSRREVTIALFAGPPVALAIAVLGKLLNPPEIDNPFQEFFRDRLLLILFGIFATTVGPLCEELAFRGFLQPLFSRTLGPVAGIILASLPFALLHGPQYRWSWQHITLITLAGLVFGVVRHLTGSTAASTGIHATYNLTFFAGSVFQRGTQPGQW